MATYKLTLEYCGTEFVGWAVQPGLRTVEQTLGDALQTALGQPVKLAVAGRTDAGVHAWEQVASFTIRSGDPELGQLVHSANGLLSHDVTVTAAELAPDDFDARASALSRTYCYRLLARRRRSPFERERALWWPQPIDEELLSQCATSLVGRHDFTAFTPTETEHVHFRRKILDADWRRNGDIFEFWIEADAFMRHMVRALVGTMLEVSSGDRDLEDFRRLLDGAPRPEAGPTADPHGLYLASVRY